MKRKGGLDLRVLIGALGARRWSRAAWRWRRAAARRARARRRTRTRSTSSRRRCSNPVRPAPPLELKNYLGQRVNIDSYRGKAVLVTFLYTNCPDVCPLITSNLRVAQNLMGRKTASKAQIIAVSVDPKGDTPKAVASFLARHGMTGRMQYLVGNAKELAKVWQAWGVGSERDANQPQFINHSGLIYGITASGQAADDLRGRLPARGNRARRARCWRRARRGDGHGARECSVWPLAAARGDRRAGRVRPRAERQSHRPSGAGAAARTARRRARDAAGLLAAAHGRPRWSCSGRAGAVRASSEAPALRAFARSAAGRGRIVGVDWSDARGNALVHPPLRLDVPDRARRRRAVGDSGT